MTQEPIEFNALSPELKRITEQMAIALSGAMLQQAQTLAETIRKIAEQTVIDQTKISSNMAAFIANEGLVKALDTMHPTDELPVGALSDAGMDLSEKLGDLE